MEINQLFEQKVFKMDNFQKRNHLAQTVALSWLPATLYSSKVLFSYSAVLLI